MDEVGNLLDSCVNVMNHATKAVTSGVFPAFTSLLQTDADSTKDWIFYDVAMLIGVQSCLFTGVVGASHQWPRLYMSESHFHACFFNLFKFFGGIIALDR